MRTSSSRILAAVAAAGLMASLSACQVKPGDYRIYKIAALPATFGADCGPSDLRDYTTLFTGGTFGVFASEPDDYFLEYGADVILGTRSGADYSFDGESVSVDGDDTVITTRRTIQIDLTITGYKVSGSFVEVNATSCAGICDNVPVGQCTVTGEFVGSEIKDAEFERPI